MADNRLEQGMLPLGGRHGLFRWLTGEPKRHRFFFYFWLVAIYSTGFKFCVKSLYRKQRRSKFSHVNL